MLCLSAMFASALLVGCATSGNYCDVASEIKMSRDDVLTDESARQIDKEQEKYAQFCGGKK